MLEQKLTMLGLEPRVRHLVLEDKLGLESGIKAKS